MRASSLGVSLVAGPSNSATVLKRLEAMRDELRGRRRDLQIQHAAEPVEQSTLYQMRDQAAMDANRDSQTLGAVLKALRRLEDGSYGFCQCGCDEPISKKRLEALPWALYRIECQERIDAELAAERAGVVLEEA
jgi:DnaK suppressor protein